MCTVLCCAAVLYCPVLYFAVSVFTVSRLSLAEQEKSRGSSALSRIALPGSKGRIFLVKVKDVYSAVIRRTQQEHSLESFVRQNVLSRPLPTASHLPAPALQEPKPKPLAVGYIFAAPKEGALTLLRRNMERPLTVHRCLSHSFVLIFREEMESCSVNG